MHWILLYFRSSFLNCWIFLLDVEFKDLHISLCTILIHLSQAVAFEPTSDGSTGLWLMLVVTFRKGLSASWVCSARVLWQLFQIRRMFVRSFLAGLMVRLALNFARVICRPSNRGASSYAIVYDMVMIQADLGVRYLN